MIERRPFPDQMNATVLLDVGNVMAARAFQPTMTLVMNVLCLEGMAGALLPKYNVLDAARPLLTTHRWLPRPVFRAALPLITRVKRLRDSMWAAHSHGRDL